MGECEKFKDIFESVSHAGTRTRVARVKGGYPDHLDYMGWGRWGDLNPRPLVKSDQRSTKLSYTVI